MGGAPGGLGGGFGGLFGFELVEAEAGYGGSFFGFGVLGDGGEGA